MLRGQKIEGGELDESTLASPGPLPDEIVAKRESNEQVTAALTRLRPGDREVLTLFYINELSHREIAAFLTVPASTVKSRLHASRKHLKEELLAMTRRGIRQQRPSRNCDFTQETVNVISALNDYQMGRLLVMTDQSDLLMLMKSATDLRDKVLARVDPKVRIVLQDIVERGSTPSATTREAQTRAVERAATIPAAQPTTTEITAMKKQLQQELEAHTFPEMELTTIPGIFQRLASCAQSEGVLSLAAFKDARDRFFANGLELLLHGTEPNLIAQVLDPWRRTMVQDQSARCEMVATAVREIVAKRHPMLVAFELMTLYSTEGTSPAVDESDVTTSGFRSRVRGASLATMPLADLAEALLILVGIAYSKREGELHDVLVDLDEPFTRSVFGWLVEGVHGKELDAEVYLPMIATCRQAVLRRTDLSYAMVADGLTCLQMGVEPKILEARIEAHL